jgi:hypothetical protein
MDDPLIFIGPLIGGLILYAIISVVVRSPGALLRHKFQAIGTLRGRSFNAIVASVGPPSSRSAASNGRTLYQWMATGYHIALIFDGDVCEGVTHEFSSSGGSMPVQRAAVAQSPVVAPTPISPPPEPEQTTVEDFIPCPLCEQRLKIAALKQGENWCPHCFQKFIVE